MSEEINKIFEQWKQFLSWCYENNDNREHSNEILITINDLLCKGLIGRRFRRYWFITDRDF